MCSKLNSVIPASEPESIAYEIGQNMVLKDSGTPEKRLRRNDDLTN